MKAEDIVELSTLLAQHGIEIWVDGGWGVDALLGRQTRAHADLDIAVKHSDLAELCRMLESRGYRHVSSGGSWECNFVMADGQGRRVDIHSFELDTRGENAFGVEYRAEHLTGEGVVGGCRVKCIAPEWMVKFHSGYPLDADDFHDVKALCEKFHLAMPEEFKRMAESRRPSGSAAFALE